MAKVCVCFFICFAFVLAVNLYLVQVRVVGGRHCCWCPFLWTICVAFVNSMEGQLFFISMDWVANLLPMYLSAFGWLKVDDRKTGEAFRSATEQQVLALPPLYHDDEP